MNEARSSAAFKACWYKLNPIWCQDGRHIVRKFVVLTNGEISTQYEVMLKCKSSDHPYQD